MADWARPFDEFAARKAREAHRAELSPFVTTFERVDDGDVAIGNAWTRRLYDGAFHLSPPSTRPQAALVFVQSRNGNTVADDPSSLGGGATDKHLVYEGLSRVAADAVLAGAETVRGAPVVFSTWHPEIVALRSELRLPRHPVQIVATRRGLPLDTTLLFNVPDIPSVILTGAEGARSMAREAAARPWTTLVIMRERDDWPSAFAELARFGIHRISVVGGRTLARSLVAAGLIEDLYLTTAPRDGGEPHTPLFEEPPAARLLARKRGTGPDAGLRLEHYRF